MDLSNNIKRIREEKGIKQIEVAKALDLDPSYYARLEKRGNKMTIEQLEMIGGVLGVNLEEIITGESVKKENEEKIKPLEEKVLSLEKDKKIQYDYISGFKQNLTEMLNMEFIFTAYDLGLYDEEQEKVTDEIEVSYTFFRDKVIKYLFNSGMVDEKSNVYNRYKKWKEFQEGQSKHLDALFSGIGKRNPNMTSLKGEVNREFSKEKKGKS